MRWLVSLRKRRARDVERLTLVEGVDELRLALEVGVKPRQLYWCDALVHDTTKHDILTRVTALGCEVVSLGEAAFVRASYREAPDGWLAVVESPECGLDDLQLGSCPLVLVCESVEKPGNLGAMLRTSEAAGVDAVVAASPVADWGNPNVVRASKGTVFAVPVAAASGGEVIDWLRGNGLTIVVATPDGTELVTAVDLTGPTAVVVGAEHSGVSSRLLAAADATIAVPMFGHVNSLNVATSAAVVLYEAVRQRGLGGCPCG